MKMKQKTIYEKINMDMNVQQAQIKEVYQRIYGENDKNKIINKPLVKFERNLNSKRNVVCGALTFARNSL